MKMQIFLDCKAIRSLAPGVSEIGLRKNCGCTLLLFFVLTCGLILPSEVLAANWFNRFGSSVITHDDSAWSSQKMGHYAAGGVSIRVPVDKTPFFNITPPRIQAGCGGIDAFWGGFSFLNPEFLIQKLKNVLQAAPAYAFNLALTQLCQTCANILSSLEAIANELNALAVDDCKASQALVAAGGHFLTNTLGVSAATGGTTGGGSDFLSGVSTFLSSGMDGVASGISKFRQSLNEMIDYKYCSGSTSHTDRDKCRKVFAVTGSLWEKAALLSEERGDQFKIDDTMVGIFKALYGDVIFEDPDLVAKKGSDSKARLGLVKRLMACDKTMDNILEAMTSTAPDPQNIQIMFQDSAAGGCVPKNASDVLGAADSPNYYGKLSREAIVNIKNSIASGDAISPSTIVLINQSVVPVYAALNIMSLRRGMGTPTGVNSEDTLIANMLASGHALFILETMHARAQEVLNQVKVFYAQIEADGPYNLDQAKAAINSMNTSMETSRYKLVQMIDAARGDYQKNMEGVVRYMAMKQVYRTLVANDLAGR